MFFDQSEYDVRFEWGLEGVRQLAPACHAVVIIDVISFTTAVDVAMNRKALVYPYASKKEDLAAFAESHGAIAAVGNRTDPNAFSLSPASMMRLPEGARVVLPSPNGSTLSLAAGATPTFAACLRNAPAVARAVAIFGQTVAVIASGERWTDGSLRPSLEDQIGAGAVIYPLTGKKSPEAQAAEAVFLRFKDGLLAALLACSSGKEIVERGGLADIELAADWNGSQAAPRLVDGAYRASF